MQYFARLVNVNDARDRFVDLWASNLPVCGDPTDKLRWFYCDGPAGRGQGFLLHREPGVADDRPIGCAGIGSRSIYLGDRRVHVGLFADLAVDRNHRTGLPALRLVGAIVRHAAASCELAYGFPNAKALAVFKRAGCHELGAMTRYVRVLRSRAYLERVLGDGMVRGAVAGVADFALSAAARFSARRAPDELELCWLDDFDERFDRLFERARVRHAIVSDRGAAVLRWRFLRVPDHAYRICALRGRDGELHAYAVVQIDAGTAAIADMLARDDDALDALLRRLVFALDGEKCASVGFRFLGNREMRRILARHRFVARDTTRSVVVSPGAVARDPEAWYLTDFDEDV
ncbi:MAG TPA: hypothetical protein VMJ10_36710 [Kofleriaceae bacterium]|nr:hypothetical protein [Kofleriaceae bacterium]